MLLHPVGIRGNDRLGMGVRFTVPFSEMFVVRCELSFQDVA